MKLEDQFCSLESSQRLRELGVKQESMFYWEITYAAYADDDKDSIVLDFHKTVPKRTDWKTCKYISAFTVAELGEMLPDYLPNVGNMIFSLCKTDHMNLKAHTKPWANVEFWHWEAGKEKGSGLKWITDTLIQAETEAEARAKMLIYLLENKLI